MAYEIHISDYNRTKVLQLPILPKELPSLSSDGSNEAFTTWWNGDFNFIEKEGLLQFTLDSWLPADSSKYYFCKSKVNAKEIIDLIVSAKKNAEPIRIVINSKNGYYVNDTFSVEKFEYNIIRRGDYKYTLGVKQWREYSTVIQKTYTVGWEQNDTGWYYYTDANGNYYKNQWQLIANEWYSFDAQGYARQSTWFKDGLEWYYLKDSCKMARSEWQKINSKWYYFASNGSMAHSGTFNIDGTYYSFNPDGSWIES